MKFSTRNLSFKSFMTQNFGTLHNIYGKTFCAHVCRWTDIEKQGVDWGSSLCIAAWGDLEDICDLVWKYWLQSTRSAQNGIKCQVAISTKCTSLSFFFFLDSWEWRNWALSHRLQDLSSHYCSSSSEAVKPTLAPPSYPQQHGAHGLNIITATSPCPPPGSQHRRANTWWGATSYTKTSALLPSCFWQTNYYKRGSSNLTRACLLFSLISPHWLLGDGSNVSDASYESRGPSDSQLCRWGTSWTARRWRKDNWWARIHWQPQTSHWKWDNSVDCR